MNKSDSGALVTKELWGSVAGKEVFLFSLKNSNGTELIVSNLGAAAVSLLVSDKNGFKRDILLGYDKLEDYVNDNFYIGTVVGRYANRIESGTVLIDGEKYQLSTRSGGYHQHGGNTGFNKKIFDAVIPEGPEPAVRFSYLSPHLEEGFPGNLQLHVTYTLDDHGNWTVDYHCETDRDTIVNLTQHAYFNLDGHDHGDILNHQLTIHSGHYLPVNDIQVPTGEIAAVVGTPFDFTEGRTIGTDIDASDVQLVLSKGYDHSWVLKSENTSELQHAATLRGSDNAIMLEVFTSEPAIHFYSGNFLDGISGKGGHAYHMRSGLCLETQHYPNAPYRPGFPSTILKRGDIFRSRTVFRVSRCI